MKGDAVSGMFMLVALAACLVWLLYAFGQQKDCEARHGVLVGDYWGWPECVGSK